MLRWKSEPASDDRGFGHNAAGDHVAREHVDSRVSNCAVVRVVAAKEASQYELPGAVIARWISTRIGHTDWMENEGLLVGAAATPPESDEHKYLNASYPLQMIVLEVHTRWGALVAQAHCSSLWKELMMRCDIHDRSSFRRAWQDYDLFAIGSHHNPPQHGAKFLLQEEVPLSSDHSLWSFLSFLGTSLGPDNLGRCLRALQLSMHGISPATAAALQRLFLRINESGTLHTLGIDHAETVLASQEGLALDMARLTTLKDLRLGDSGERCAELLRNLRSKLVTATIAFGNFHEQEWTEDSVDPPHAYDPIYLLAQSCDTLTTLDVANPGPYPPANVHVYPILRVLEYENITFPTVKHVLRAFPGLRVLKITGDSPSWFDDGLVRGLNIEYQVAHGSWTALDNVGASTIILWHMGLQCTVRWLNITLTDDYELNFLSDVLSDSRPLKVRLVIHEATKLLDSRMKTLHLCVLLGSRDADLDIAMLLDTVVGIAQVRRLTNLKLIFDCGNIAPSLGDSAPPARDDDRLASSNGVECPRVLHQIEVSLALLSLPDVAERIQSAVPTLFTTEIQVRRHYTRGDQVASASSRGPPPGQGSESLGQNASTAKPGRWSEPAVWCWSQLFLN
ncbi:hypothetical protein C8T65DRAFT_788067 [Cerioporus squamosus]|nr:hypothetical protein C8T65DRAFT_788067 [Cerioporus squamosus]